MSLFEPGTLFFKSGSRISTEFLRIVVINWHSTSLVWKNHAITAQLYCHRSLIQNTEYLRSSFNMTTCHFLTIDDLMIDCFMLFLLVLFLNISFFALSHPTYPTSVLYNIYASPYSQPKRHHMVKINKWTTNKVPNTS